MFLKRWREKRKQKEEERRRCRLAEYNGARDSIEKQIAVAKELMLNKPCPFVESGFCTDKCVHFQDGYAYSQVIDDPLGIIKSPIISCQHPRCRLWS